MYEASQNVPLNQTDSCGLCFGSVEDARDFAAKSVQDSIDWLAANYINFSKRYIKGDVHIVCRVCSVFDLTQYDLVFSRIPHGREVETAESSGAVEVLDHCAAGSLADWHNDPMFSGVGNLIERPKKVVPSAIRIERPKERRDLRREVFTAPTYQTIKVSCRGSEGEISLLELGISASDSAGESSLVEGGPKIGGDVCGYAAQSFREFLGEFDLVDIESGFRIVLNNTGVWCWIEESANLPFEFVDIFICASEQ